MLLAGMCADGWWNRRWSFARSSKKALHALVNTDFRSVSSAVNNMQHYSSSASEPVTMFSSSYRTQNSRAIALSCPGRYATGALLRRRRSHRRGLHSLHRCLPFACPAQQKPDLPSCSGRLRRSEPCCGRS